MAIFKKKVTAKAEPNVKETKVTKKKEEKVMATTEIATAGESQSDFKKGRGLDLAQVILRPHVTEKATDLSERGVYAFEINKRANKAEVKRAVEELFKVSPIKVAVIMEPTKYTKNPRTNRVVVKHAGRKKALVYLKKGDKIEFV